MDLSCKMFGEVTIGWEICFALGVQKTDCLDRNLILLRMVM